MGWAYKHHNYGHPTAELSKEHRHQAIVKCLIAFSRFMRAELPSVQWWLDSGTLIGALRGGKFVPWDEDADVAMRASGWEQTVELMKAWKDKGLPSAGRRTGHSGFTNGWDGWYIDTAL